MNVYAYYYDLVLGLKDENAGVCVKRLETKLFIEDNYILILKAVWLLEFI